MTPPPKRVFSENFLENRVALVTGGGTGIGKGIAKMLGVHGAKIAIASRKQQVLDATCEELTREGIECLAIACDIRDTDSIESLMKAIMQQWGRLDILVNNAAGNFPARIEDISANGFKTVVDIDLQGTFNVSKAAFQASFKANGGAIINITAPYDGFGVAWQSHAAAAKAGIISFTRSAAVEWAPLGIRVNAVAPGGVIGTEGTNRLKDTLSDAAEKGKYGTPEDIANAVMFLASDAARFITGVNLIVDGGSSIDMLKMPVYE